MVSEQLQGQARLLHLALQPKALVVGLVVPLQQPAPGRDPGLAEERSAGPLLVGLRRPRFSPGGPPALEEEGQGRQAARTAGSTPPSSRPRRRSPWSRQLDTWGVGHVGSADVLFPPSPPRTLLQLQPSTVPCSNLPPGDFCGLLVFSQHLLQTWDGEQPGPLQPRRGRSSLPPRLHSPYLHVQVATPGGPSSGSPGTSYSFWLCSSSHLSVFTSPFQRSSESQDLLADILLTLPTLSVSATRKVGCKERGCCDHGLPTTPR